MGEERIITRIEDSPNYGKRGYNSEQIINVSNNTSGGQEQDNNNQSQGDDKKKGK
jgi:hypothetical protein